MDVGGEVHLEEEAEAGVEEVQGAQQGVPGVLGTNIEQYSKQRYQRKLSNIYLYSHQLHEKTRQHSEAVDGDGDVDVDADADANGDGDADYHG